MNLKSLFRRKSISNILKESESGGENKLVRSLGVRDLTFLGIAAIIGAGIFGTIGTASVHGGPAVSMLFVFTSIACLFSAMCYAQFASTVPVSGSAYTYAYISFGELIAWIIGWDLLMEYAIGNVTVAISWSDYFTAFLTKTLHIHIPEYFSQDYLSANRAYNTYENLILENKEIPTSVLEGYKAWMKAPMIGGLRLILDLPALVINVLITALVYVGIKESKRTNNLLVLLKLLIVFIVIAAGVGYINTDNYDPFAPNGLSGVMRGVSSVFFAYIGFDAISTTSEEAINPKRDLPRSMIMALLICTILYVILTLVLTGMVNYKLLGVGDPLAYAFEKTGLKYLSGIIAAGAVIAMTSVLLVFQLGQPRIWMSMSRDGLLPKAFSKIHPKYQTPGFATIVTGIVVGLPILFFNLEEVTDLTSIGTLFAFVLVCGGALITTPHNNAGGYKIPFINGKWIVPHLLILGWIIAIYFNLQGIKNFFTYDKFETFQHKIPFILFLIFTVGITIATFIKNLSLIPVLGLTTNLYLMTELNVVSWIRFVIWLVIGLVFYFMYGYWKSKLNEERRKENK